MIKKKIDISVVVPVYNEEKNIVPFLDRILPVLNKISHNYEIIFVLDPSTDQTREIIFGSLSSNDKIKVIILSRRFGQPAATMAGIKNSSGEVCVIIDVDLQDPPELIEEMYNKYLQGYQVVLARRTSRKGETFVKKIVSVLGYKIINYASEIKIPTNTGDFRLISKNIVKYLKELNEPHNFLRGLVSYIGFKYAFVEYNRVERYLEKSKYNKFFGSFKIGLNGLISFSSKPLYLMTAAGFFFSIIGFFLGVWYVIQKLIGVNLTPGLSTTVLLITFFSGIQLLSLGLIGEYVGRIYDQTKNRPPYIIDEKINFDE
jgi:glycosyltransferase involved in cell wall biosynthesis